MKDKFFTRIYSSLAKDNNAEIYFSCTEGYALDGTRSGDVVYRVSDNDDMIGGKDFLVKVKIINDDDVLIIINLLNIFIVFDYVKNTYKYNMNYELLIEYIPSGLLMSSPYVPYNNVFVCSSDEASVLFNCSVNEKYEGLCVLGKFLRR